MAKWSYTAQLSSRWRWKLEDSGFLSIYSRLIVVCGMARTATSATAAYIGSHPDVRLVVNGHQWYRAENDLVLGDVDWETIDRLLRENRPNRILLKRPWLERLQEFFDRAQEAKVIVCFRETETLFQSWYASETAGPQGRTNPQAVYDEQLPFCERRLKDGALKIDMEILGRYQAQRIGEFLGLDWTGFDNSRIERKWAGLNEREWLEKNTIWLKEENERNNHCDCIPGGNVPHVRNMPEGDTAVYEN
jgi:hypothetical protein